MDFNKNLTEVSIVFCSDQYLLRLNRQFLDHDFYTDIITFDYPHDHTAELYISIDRVRENAINLAIPFTQELHRVVIHGLLHIVGLKDKAPYQKMKMRKAENKYLLKIQRST